MAKRYGDSAAWQHLYKTARWERIRQAQFASEPLCVMCLQSEEVTIATICDHINQHKGDTIAFHAGPFQSLCKSCHDKFKQREERGQTVVRYGADGWPL